jgi:hypothetical protein
VSYDLETLANLAEIFGAITVIGGAVFAVSQLREFRRQRRETVAGELMRSCYNPELARAVYLVRQAPDGVGAGDLRAMGEEYDRAAILICTTCETIGLLTFREIASFMLVRELTGGLAVVMWRKLSRWVEEVRDEQGQPSWAEWFQWLAERLDEWAEENQRAPAYIREAAWRPRS